MLTIEMERTGRLLFSILDEAGSSEEMRHFKLKSILDSEILQTAVCRMYTPTLECYMVGSFGEGTAEIDSDIDIIHCRYIDPVHETPTGNSGDHLLIYRDSHTKHGYVMIRDVSGKQSKLIEHIKYEWNGPYGFKFNIRHGPAHTLLRTSLLNDADLVFAFKSVSIPSFARQWLQRTRYFGWPSSDQLSEFESSDCFFVGVGHPDSDDNRKNREWRISFTLQEQQLILSLNPTQYKCYILLKMVKKNIIQKTIGESISSYHCKTALFYTIENSPCELWVPKNLVECVRSCIFRLLVWSIQGHCPNYFIPAENMFDKTECKNILHKIRYITLQILQSGIRFLFKLTSNSVGSALEEFISVKPSTVLSDFIRFVPMLTSNSVGSELEECISLKSFANLSDLLSRKSCFESSIYGNNVGQDLLWRNTFLASAMDVEGKQPSVQLNFVINLCKQLYIYTKTVKRHTNTAVHQAFEPQLMWINLQFAQDSASSLSYCEAENASKKQEYLNRVLHFTNKSLGWDVLSADLIVATVYYNLNMFQECRYKLTHSLTIDSYVTSMCRCNGPLPIYGDIFEQNMARHFTNTRKKRITTKEYRQTYVSTCLVFLPNQRHLVHPILHLEMLRYFGKTSDAGQHDWHEYMWIKIDSKIYFYFLKYLLYTKLKDMTQKQLAIDDMRFILKEDLSLGHRETAYNVLSWMYRQENKMAEAYSCLRESWKVKSGHNAAKWHTVLLLWDYWNIQT